MPTDTLVDTTPDSSTSRSSNLVLVGADIHDDVKTSTAEPQQQLNDLSRLLLEFRLTSEQKAEKDAKLIKRISKQIFWLKTALFLTLLALSGSLVFSNQSLKSQQAELLATVDTLAAQDGPSGTLVSRIDALEEQTKQIESAVSNDLFDQVAATQLQLDTLSTTVSSLETNLDQRQSAAAVLATALQSLVEDPSGTPATVEETKASNSSEIAPSTSAEPDAELEKVPADSSENN